MALAALLLAGCSSEDDENIVRTWSLTAASSHGVDIAVPNNPYSTDLTAPFFWIRFGTDGTLGGRLVCNGFAGTYTFADSTIRPFEVSMSLVGCPVDHDLETLLSKRLWPGVSQVTIHEADPDIMIWTSDEAVLTFTRQ